MLTEAMRQLDEAREHLHRDPATYFISPENVKGVDSGLQLAMDVLESAIISTPYTPEELMVALMADGFTVSINPYYDKSFFCGVGYRVEVRGMHGMAYSTAPTILAALRDVGQKVGCSWGHAAGAFDPGKLQALIDACFTAITEKPSAAPFKRAASALIGEIGDRDIRTLDGSAKEQLEHVVRDLIPHLNPRRYTPVQLIKSMIGAAYELQDVLDALVEANV